MACVTLVGGVDVVKALAAGKCSIMAINASTGNVCMIHRAGRHGRPEGRQFLVASVTYVAGGHMVNTFTTGKHAIMTSNTIISEGGVVHRSRNPLLHVMAIITGLGCRDMSWTLAGGNHIVMATGAGTNNFIVIHGGG